VRPPETREQLAGLSGIAVRQHAAALIVAADLEKPPPRAELAQALLLGGEGDAVLAAILGDEARRALDVSAVDIDPFAEAAVGLNARANRVRLAYSTRDLLDDPPPAVDVLLAADTWYEGPVAERFMPWLRASAAAGVRVLIGDPGRKYLPDPVDAGLVELARYDVRTTTTLEDREVVEARVFEVF